MRTRRNWWPNLIMMVCATLLTTFVVLISCEKEPILPMQKSSLQQADDQGSDIYPVGEICGEIERKALVLKNGRTVGQLEVFNDSRSFYLSASSDRGYRLGNAYAYTGTFERIPLTVEKDPDVKSFPYSVETGNYSATKRFRIPLSDLASGFLISFMVEVKPTFSTGSLGRPQRAWADGREYGNTEKGTVFFYEKNICAIMDPVAVDE